MTENGRAVGGNPLDMALWDSPAAARQQTALAHYRRLATLPFDHERRLVSVLVEDGQGDRRSSPRAPLRGCSTGAPASPVGAQGA